MGKNRIRIAIVDDDASVLRAISRMLRSFEFYTETYSSGREFLEALDVFRPQCVVLDLHMESMSGVDIQRHLLRIGHPTPTIVITGHDNLQIREESLGLGAGAFLPKPVDDDLLVDTIKRLVRNSPRLL
jgi:FixJ family two-component response regulator